MKRKIILIFIVLLVFLFGLNILTKRPSHDKEWDEAVNHLPIISILNDTVTIKNIRDWKYTSEGIASKDWITDSFNVSELKQMWLAVEPFYAWDGIAHTMFVFEFADYKTVAFSIEARKETGETYSPLLGLLNEYELIYQWGSEEDLVTRRELYLGHKVYLYPLEISQESTKAFFLKLVSETHEIVANPRFYNTVFSNCTNNFANYANEIKPGSIPWHPARLLTGYADDYLYTLKYISNKRSFRETMENALISEKVKRYDGSMSFSKYLRER